MKSLIALSLGLLLYMNVFSQFKTETRIDLAKDKILNKNSGIRFTEQELIEMVKGNNNIRFEPIINKYGVPDYYVCDPFKTGSTLNPGLSDRTKNGGIFPPFVMRTINNTILNSDDLKGKFILMQFQLDFNKPFFNVEALNEIKILTRDLKNKIEIVPMILTLGEKNDITNAVNTSDYNVDFVADAHNFSLRYQVFNFPTMILIDKNGMLISYYNFGEFGNIRADILKNN